MKINAEIVCDSIGPSNIRLITMKLTFPRFILPEFNTHRMISKNASSSRAIPVSKQIESVKNNPFIPLAFNKNAKGMQGGEVMSDAEQDLAKKEWLRARDAAVLSAEEFVKLGVSKQYANRILEPFSWTTVVCTATDWDNFFALRCHEAAQPEIHALADLMYEKYVSNIPDKLGNGYWHLPFMDKESVKETKEFCRVNSFHGITRTLIKRSVARCARVSYLNHDGTSSTVEQDLQLYDRLLGSTPIHASPAEHQAKAIKDPKKYSGNFKGWTQYRKTLKNENIKKFNK